MSCVRSWCGVIMMYMSMCCSVLKTYDIPAVPKMLDRYSHLQQNGEKMLEQVLFELFYRPQTSLGLISRSSVCSCASSLRISQVYKLDKRSTPSLMSPSYLNSLLITSCCASGIICDTSFVVNVIESQCTSRVRLREFSFVIVPEIETNPAATFLVCQRMI